MLQRLRVPEWPGLVASRPLPFLITLLLGLGSGVAYTCGPLHDAKTWKIDYLDGQLTIQNQRVRELEHTLEETRADSEGSLGSTAAAALRKELERAEGERARRAEAAERAEENTEKTARSRDQWRAKHRAAEKELESLRAERSRLAAERDSLLAQLDALRAPPPAAPAAAPDETATPPAPEAALGAGLLELMVGESWSSPNGSVSFDVVEVGNETADLRGSWQRGASSPERVRVGHELRDDRAEVPYRVTVKALTPYRSITIQTLADAP